MSSLHKLINNLLSSSNPLYLAELCDEYIKDDGCKLVCDKLSPIDTIHTIDFRGNDIQQIGAQAIVELIQRNKNIKTLKLEWNLLGLQNALSVLCQGLILSSISYLDLRNNKIDSSGGKIISEMLSNNKTLYHIDLRWNNLGLIGGECILQTLLSDAENYTLKQCLLSGNQIPVQILRSIDNKLNKNKNKHKNKQQSVELHRAQIVSKENIENVENIQTISETNETHDTIQTLQEELNELFGEKTCLQAENERMKIKCDDLESENLDLKDKYESAHNEKEKLEKAIIESDNKYEKDTKELKNKIKELEINVDELHKSRQCDKLEFDNIKKLIENDHNIQINKLRETNDFELNNLRETTNELHIEVNELKTSNNTLRSEILENEILMERKYIEFEKNVRNECNKTLTVKINNLEKNIKSIKKSRDDLEFEMKTEKNKYSQLIEQIETEKNQYQKWLNDEQKAKLMLENEKRNLSMDIQKYTNVITQKNQQIESLKIGLKETQKSIKILQDEHQLSMQRVLSEHNKQILVLEKSLRQNQQRLTMTNHRKRGLELRLLKIEDEQQRKIAAVHDAVKCLTNSFVIFTHDYDEDVVENKENINNEFILQSQNTKHTFKHRKKIIKTPTKCIIYENKIDCIKVAEPTKSVHNIIQYDNDEDEDDEETIIEIIDDDDDDDDEYSIDEILDDDEYSVDEFQEKIKDGNSKKLLEPIKF